MDAEDGSELAAGRNAVARAKIAGVYQRTELVAQLDIERNVTFGLEMYGQHCLSQKANCSRYWTGARANLSCRVFGGMWRKSLRDDAINFRANPDLWRERAWCRIRGLRSSALPRVAGRRAA